MNAPNFLITNFCNQSCPFCFASKEMSHKRQNKEINLQDFERYLNELSKLKVETIKLLGGEPTLHSQLSQIIDLSLKKFKYVQIFTNGLVPAEKIKILEKYYPKVRLTFNTTTPAFINNTKSREYLSKLIIKIARKTQVTLSITLDPFFDIDRYISILDLKMLFTVQEIRIGPANPVAGQGNWYSFADFPKIGSNIYKLVYFFRKKIKNNTRIMLNCGITRCMFTDEQYQFLIDKKVFIHGFGCFGKSGSMDIATDNTAFHCLSLSNELRINLRKESIKSASNSLVKQNLKYRSKFIQDKCQSCPYYGYSKDKCPGPCLGFLINQ
jgi:MoaA/NifB/PqqE/SkfB family radical SAM enzyme